MLLKLPRWRAPERRTSPAERLRSLVEVHFDFIGRSLRRLGVQEADVDDACQQVFLVASRRLDEIQDGKEKSFLFGVALRVASDARRARRRRAAILDEHSEETDSPNESLSPESLLHQRRARALLDEILETMPLELRTVFVLFELEEMTASEIAQTIDIPPGTVASRLRRAREIFHEQSRRLRAAQERLTP
ncbi:MAG: sigma-70 family RNA polymerase sigma factor [Myxococcales bacterium]|nr:sigma-70 family RNA polymerase sigma factor [Polyangiaceae bacterium]MDW8249886.1 sigma-70 family RNA polymerase sigma factor [Myxococcales bacterium]